MDNKGVFSLNMVFSFIFIILIAIAILYYAENNIYSFENIERSTESRLLLDNISNLINQVSSNGNGYSKHITLPEKIDNHPFIITVKSNEILLESNNYKGTSIINPIVLISQDELFISEFKMFSSESYIISKNTHGNIVIRRY